MFQGFCPETVDFLWGIRLNNNREWFEAHKKEYQETLYQPMKALGEEIFSRFRDVPNLACKVSRIYKDARLHPPVPYKESLWISMRPDGLPWSEQPTLYFEIRPEGYSYGFVLWHPRTEAMNRYRSLLDARPDDFLKLIEKTEASSHVSLTGMEYYRKKNCGDPRIAPYYNLKNLEMDVDRKPDELLFSSELASTVTETLQALYPMYEYCLKFTI